MKPYLLVAGNFVKTGGMDRANYALALHLGERGFPTHLVGYRVDPGLAGLPNVFYHRVPKPLNSYFLAGPLLSRAGLKFAPQVAAKGGRIVVNGGNCLWPDVNWVHHLHLTYKPQVQAGVLWRLKGELHFKWAAISERRAFGMARVFITNSNRTREDLIREYRVPEQRVHTAYLGVDGELFYPRSPEQRCAARASLGWPQQLPVALFVGALGDRRKGLDTLFAAWERLCSGRDWDANLAVIGQGTELKTWQKRTSDARLAPRIQFMGHCDNLPEVMAACDVFVSPTRYEGYGLAIQEAISCGLPAIVSRAAPVTERFAGAMDELLLPDPEDVDGLIHRLRLWRSRRPEFASAAGVLSARLRQRSWRDMASEMVAIAEANPPAALSA